MIMTLDMTFHKIDISDFKITRKSVVRIFFQTLDYIFGQAKFVNCLKFNLPKGIRNNVKKKV